MDVDLTQDALAGVNESMRCIRGCDNNGTGFHFARFIPDRDGGSSFDGERDFYVGMLVQRRALPGFGRDDVGREGRAFFFADEIMRHSDKRELLEIEEAHRENLRESQVEFYLFRAQCLHRIDERGATGGQKAGHQCGGRK